MITCRFFEKWVSWNADANPALPRWAQRHMQSCSACREFYGSMRFTAQGLSAGAEGERQPPPPFLRAKILSAIRAQENAKPQSTGAQLRWGLTIGTACVLLASLVWLHRPVAPVKSASQSGPVPKALTLNLPDVARVDAWMNTLDQPLDNEMQFVLDDAQTAIKYLQKSFLPLKVVNPQPEQDKPQM